MDTNNLNFSKLDTFDYVVLVIWSLLAFFVLITALIYFLSWIYYSWIRKGNSRNCTGGEFANHLINEKLKFNANIQRGGFVFKYWNFSRRTNTLKLIVWTHDRNSIWTLQEVAQQVVVAKWTQQKNIRRWFVRCSRWFGLIISLFIMFLAAVTFFGISALHNFNQMNPTDDILLISIGLLTFIAIESFAVAYGFYSCNKEALKLIKGTLSEKEFKIIKRIYRIKLLYFLAQAIYTTARDIAHIAKYVKRR